MRYLLLSVLLSLLPLRLSAEEHPHHELHVRLIPEKGLLEATDNITMPESISSIEFYLHKDLKITDVKPEASLVLKAQEGRAHRIEISFNEPVKTFTIRYEGIIDEPVETIGETARGYSHTGGTISPKGIFLHGGSYWYPVFQGRLITFRLHLVLPEGWYGISQGNEISEETQLSSVVWDSPEPQEEIYLVANRFIRYKKELDGIKAGVFLKEDEPELARRYLSATFRYIKLYEELIGPYPYRKFYLVENFFESGFGMPSFTLLGPKVLRLPFIIDSSYPHEILHNWFGNSIYPRPGRGNWTEGLTAYLSDHLLKEMKEEDREYRFTVLQKYADYVDTGRDFPLEDFRMRHSAVTEAVGYGKSLYLFHMLRKRLGERLFIEGLRDFYKRKRFHYADFDDLRESFERVSGMDLDRFFKEWTTRKGAPEIRIKDAEIREEKDMWRLRIVLSQTQEGEAYHLRIPFIVTFKEERYEDVMEVSTKEEVFEYTFKGKPLRIDIDPQLDIFRRLTKEEIPPAITGVLGSKTVTIVIPSNEDLQDAYEDVIDVIKKAGPEEIRILKEKELKVPPPGTVILLGWRNGLLKHILERWQDNSEGITITEDSFVIEGKTFSPESVSLVFVTSNPSGDGLLMFIGSNNRETLRNLSRKLPHYHKYSYLLFEGKDAVNILKGRWRPRGSPLSVIFEENAERPEIKRVPLIPSISREELLNRITYLTSEKLRGRRSGTEEALRVADYIAQSFIGSGLIPGYGKDYLQRWEYKGKTYVNVIGKIKGTEGGCIVVGAHHDHLGIDEKGNIYPGADDNASGVALLLELARIIAQKDRPLRDILFVAFDGEEEGRIGSRYFVKDYPIQCIAMINLDTVGRLYKKKILVIGSQSAKEWPLLLEEAELLSGVSFESVKEELDSSDQRSFIEAGIPAIQLFSGPHPDYHRITDTADKIDLDGLILIGKFTEALLKRIELRGGLSFTETASIGNSSGNTRRVTLGTVPDFTYKEEGYRISDVIKGSPAETSGLKKGDVIIEFNGRPVRGIRDLSQYLKDVTPGERIQLKIKRDGRELSIDLIVEKRE